MAENWVVKMASATIQEMSVLKHPDRCRLETTNMFRAIDVLEIVLDRMPRFYSFRS